MSDLTFKLIAVGLYFLAMIGIGFYAFRKTRSGDDYMLGGRSLSPFTAALSAGASDMSGWLMMGLPGALYMSGLVEGWMAIGLTTGAALNWIFVAPRLRRFTEVAGDSITIPSYFDNRLGDTTRLLRVASGLVILVFFTFYVSSGMAAGGKFFVSAFGGEYWIGMLLVAGITLLYTMFGGFLGATYTDMVQGLIMLAALLIVPTLAIGAVGGPGAMFESVGQVNPDFGSLVTGATVIGVISSAAWGLGYFGQPHIIIRFMALRTPSDARQGRFYGVTWMFLSVIGAIFVALVGTVFFTQNDYKITDQENFETIFLDMAQVMFHPLPAGLVLTAVLAAIMSTMSSQLLAVSTSLIEDLAKIFLKRTPSQSTLINLSRTMVLCIAIIAALMAINPSDSILALVGFAWAGFGAAFGPLVLYSLYWRRLNVPGAVSGMVVGALTTVIWGMSPLSDVLYEIVPGFLASAIVTYVVSISTGQPDPRVKEEFDHATELSRLVEQNKNLDFEEAAEKAQS